MAGMVTGPWEVDHTLVSAQSDVAPTTALPDIGSLSVLVFGTSLSDAASAHHYVTGFVSGRGTVGGETHGPCQRGVTVPQQPRRRGGRPAMAAANLTIPARVMSRPPDSESRATQRLWPTSPQCPGI